ncbi:MAG: apolipoprotein N-acyltransferase [Candidatus Kapabacteria bacterium]|nr:apolipoprotein N-acyltransferase [Candidatus Kapabacteria bacterium]
MANIPTANTRPFAQASFASIAALCFAAGAAGGFSFAPSPLGFLALVCFVPLLLGIEELIYRNVPFRKHLLLNYIFFFAFHGAGNWWVMSWQKETDPFLMIAGAALWLGHPFFLMPAFLLYRSIRSRYSEARALMVLPFLCTAIEWLHSLTDASYPWLAVGYTQVYHTILIQSADVWGVWGVGWLIYCMNAVLAWWVMQRQIMQREAIAFGAALVILLGYGAWRMSSVDAAMSDATKIRASVVQPNINPWQKWDGDIHSMIEQHIRLQDSVNALTQSDISIWSETAIPDDLQLPQNAHHAARLHAWVDSSNTALLTGTADYVFYPAATAPPTARRSPLNPDLKWTIFNAAALYSQGDTGTSIHHKSRLTPFGEGVPFSDDLTFLRSWLNWGVGISGWNKGGGATVLPLRRGNDTAARIGPVICIESVYPSFVADYARRGADILSVITNDAWYDGTAGPEQHYCIARLRAVESRRAIIRCGNSGISGLIDACGRSVQQEQPRTPLAATYSAPLLHIITPYMTLGDWLPMLSCVVMFGVVLRIRFIKK